MDVGHDAGRTRARLYPDSDVEVDLIWYVARDDAPLLGCPSAINNLKLVKEVEALTPTLVGQVVGAPFVKRPNTPNLLATGGHRCGTVEDFAGKGTIDLAPPFVEYRPDGLPACCGDAFAGAGGAVAGGVATVAYAAPVFGGASGGGSASVHYSPAIAGGAVGGGAADVWVTDLITAAGGGVGGGAADVWVGELVEASGGAVGGGAADVWVGELVEASGGAVGGGAADVWVTDLITAAGGGVGGGAADVWVTDLITAAGGGVGGGAADVWVTDLITAAGGGVGGGAADVWVTDLITAAGGGVGGGAADVEYTPPGPEPGADCDSAGVIDFATEYGATSGTPDPSQWWRLPGLTDGTTYHVTTSSVGGLNVTMNLKEGSDCSLLTPILPTNPSANCWEFTKSGDGSLWLEFQNGFSGSQAYTFQVDTGAC